MSGTAKSRLQELASHLHGALTECERKMTRPIENRQRHRGEGRRFPKISLEEDHISLSWIGDHNYHATVWNKTALKNVNVHYDLLVFYKSSQIPPKAWLETMQWTGDPSMPPVDCWQEILLESYIVLTKNTAQTVSRRNGKSTGPAIEAGKPVIDPKAQSQPRNLTAALTTIKTDRWFAFPGLVGKNSRDGQKHRSGRGQVSGQVPGEEDHKASTRTRKTFPAGQCIFRLESDVAAAILTKIYPKNDERENGAQKGGGPGGALFWFPATLMALLVFSVVYFWRNCPEAGIEPGSLGCRACEIVDAIKGNIPQEQSARQRETELALKAADAEADRQKVQLEAQTERISSQSREIERLETLPGGLDEPPCWLDESGTRPEFLYDITISEEGLRISRTDLPHREADYLLLPVSGVPMNETLSERSFSRYFRELYKGSIQNQCRHFVRVYEGHHDQVDRYKAQRDVIEGYFYIYRPDRRRY